METQMLYRAYLDVNAREPIVHSVRAEQIYLIAWYQ
jgi:hypothetical protein